MFIVNAGDITDPLIDLISIKDPHLNFGFANRIRHDANSDLINKHQFVRDYCIKNNIDKLIMTGDVTDTNDEKKWSFRQYFLNKTELMKYRDLGIGLFSIAGNHDMFNGMEKTDETVFGELVREGVISYITKDNMSFDFMVGDIKKSIVIYGVDYSKHKEVVEKGLMAIDSIDSENKNLVKIVVLHSHVTPAEVAATDFTYEYLLKTYRNISMFICGHYHGGFPTSTFYKKNEDGTDDTTGHVTFINNWSFQRVVRDYYNEMDVHTPEFERIKFGWSVAYNSFICSCEKVIIPHKSYDDAFKPKVVQLLRLTKKEQFEFFEKINFEEIPTGNDDLETINNISKKDNVDAEIVNLAIMYLNNVNVSDEDI